MTKTNDKDEDTFTAQQSTKRAEQNMGGPGQNQGSSVN